MYVKLSFKHSFKFGSLLRHFFNQSAETKRRELDDFVKDIVNKNIIFIKIITIKLYAVSYTLYCQNLFK